METKLNIQISRKTTDGMLVFSALSYDKVKKSIKNEVRNCISILFLLN